MASNEAESLFHQWLEAGGKKDKAAIMALLADDALIELPFNESGITDEGHYRQYRGTAELNTFFDGAFAAEDHVDIYDVEVTNSANGQTAFVEARGNGVMTSGREYRNRYVFRIDARDGKIVRMREYYNPIQTAYAFNRPIAGRLVVDSL